jgi:protein TonB
MRSPTLRFGLVAAAHAALLLPLLGNAPPAEPAPLPVFSARLLTATTAARDTPAAATPALLKPSPARRPPPAPSLVGSTASTSSPSSMAATASAAAAGVAVSTTSAPANLASAASGPSGANAVLAEARYDAAYLHNPKPAYPPASRRGGEQGQVLLRVTVAADGSAQAVQVIAGSGFSRLDQAALEAVRRWKFVPAKRGDSPVDGVVRVPINFSLEDA